MQSMKIYCICIALHANGIQVDSSTLNKFICHLGVSGLCCGFYSILMENPVS